MSPDQFRAAAGTGGAADGDGCPGV